MMQVQVRASQEHCWEVFSKPEYWRQWAPWVPLDLPRHPRRGSRILFRLGSIPMPGKITVWQPCWRWDWRWGTVAWRHQIDLIDENHCLVSIELQGPGSKTIETVYGPIMKVALRRFRDVAEQSYQGRVESP